LILGVPAGHKQLDELSQKVQCIIDTKLGGHYNWPGNVRELEQHIRSILLTGTCQPIQTHPTKDAASLLHSGIDKSSCNADELLSGYCKLLYDRFGTYEEVARRAELDRRTAKKYIQL
jgi:transcriptional regulator with PAS, ATPase and Fis domain